MHDALWIAQFVLAIIFAVAGMLKLVQPRARLMATQAWMEAYDVTTVKFIGAVEVLGALALVSPALAGAGQWLIPIAAAGLAVIIVLAIATHLRRQEYPNVWVNVSLLALALFVVWGRWIYAPL